MSQTALRASSVHAADDPIIESGLYSIDLSSAMNVAADIIEVGGEKQPTITDGDNHYFLAGVQIDFSTVPSATVTLTITISGEEAGDWVVESANGMEWTSAGTNAWQQALSVSLFQAAKGMNEPIDVPFQFVHTSGKTVDPVVRINPQG